jgi:hypothetical protein
MGQIPDSMLATTTTMYNDIRERLLPQEAAILAATPAIATEEPSTPAPAHSFHTTLVIVIAGTTTLH